MASFQPERHEKASLRTSPMEQSGLQLPLWAVLEAGRPSLAGHGEPTTWVEPWKAALAPLALPGSWLAPTLVLVSIWAPRSSRSRTMITFPLREAMCSGVMPFWKGGRDWSGRVSLSGRQLLCALLPCGPAPAQGKRPSEPTVRTLLA